MYEHILAWVGFAFLLLLCLPFAGTRKLILEVYGWAVRLALVALLAGGAVLWFRPELLPTQVVTFVDAIPGLWDILPIAGSQTFGLALAAIAAAVLLPLLAILDVTRKLAGSRLRRLRKLADAARPQPVVPEGTAVSPAPVRHRPDRRAAADTLAEIGSRKPYRVADHLP